MPNFKYDFIVNAPLSAVRGFHHDTRALKTLTPPPIFAQIHHYDTLAEGSKADFTLWFGPFPIHWQAIHSDVGEHGFTDTQVNGPLKQWRHTHRFTAVGEKKTLVSEHIDYEYDQGIRGVIGRLLFSPMALTMLFTARKIITRRRIGKSSLS